MAAREKRFSSKGVFLRVVGTLVVASLLYVFAYRPIYVPHGFIVALTPVDEHRAVIVLRANDAWRRQQRGFIGLMDAEHGWVWTKPISGVPSVVGPNNGLLVDRGTIFVRTEGRDSQRQPNDTGTTQAFDLATGASKWWKKFPKPQPDTYVDLVLAGPHIVQGAARTKEGHALDLLDPATGDVTATLRTDPGDILRLRVSKDTFVLEDTFKTTFIPFADPTKHRELPLHTNGCIEGGEYVALDIKADGFRVFGQALSSGTEREIATGGSSFPGGSQAIACAYFGESIVFLVSAKTQFEGRLGLLSVRGRDTSYQGLDLDAAELVTLDPTPLMFPEAAPFGGHIPRFVPLFGRSALIVVDVEERKVGRHSIAESGSVFRIGDSFFLQGPGRKDEPLIARFDGKTGELVAAVTLETPSKVQPFHVCAGRLWVYRDAWLSDPPYAALDALTLLRQPGGTLSVTDATAAARDAWFR